MTPEMLSPELLGNLYTFAAYHLLSTVLIGIGIFVLIKIFEPRRH